MRRLTSAARDPFLASMAVLGVLVACSLVAVAMAWRGAAGTRDVSAQVPYIVSGAIGGLGLLAFGLGVMVVQLRRRDEAAQRQEVDRVVAAARELLAEVQGR